MARAKWFGYLLNEQGQVITAANIYVYLAGTETLAYVYTNETGDNTKRTFDENTALHTNADGYYEFWIGDTSETYGYPSSQKFKIAWSKTGIVNGYNDYISILPLALPVDVESTNTEKDKSVSNNLARLWEEHRTDSSYYLHGIESVDYTSADTTVNKLVSNAYAKEWQDTRWVKWEYVDYSNLEAESNRGYVLDSTDTAINVFLPSTPSVGDTVIAATVNVNNTIKIDRNGNYIFGEAQDLYLDLNQSGLTLVYTGASYGWTIVSEISGVSPLDGDTVEVGYVPTNYTRDETIDEADSQLSLSAHLKGVDDELARIRDTRYEYEIIKIGNAFDGTSPPAAEETITSGSGAVSVRKFSGTTTEDVQIALEINENLIAAEGVQFKVISFVTETTTPSAEGVAFAIDGYSVSDGENLNQSFGTEVVTSRTGLTLSQYDRIDSGWSNDLDISPAGSDMVQLRLSRPHDHTDDTYGQDIGIAYIKIRYRMNVVETS